MTTDTGPPLEVIQSLERYRDDHIPTGGFLEAVLSNDLKEALGRADRQNRDALFEIVRWVYNYMPMTACGSKEAVANWLASR